MTENFLYLMENAKLYIWDTQCLQVGYSSKRCNSQTGEC